MNAPVRPRNDVEQYDDLVDQWWQPTGAFAALHWIAASRRALIPPADRVGARLLDVACGGGVLAPHVPPGYDHVGVDLVASALDQARRHGVRVVCADAVRLPFADGAFEVVVAGEMLEHVTDLPGTVRELCRVLAPGGTVVVDTIADTAWARFSLVTVGERLPGGPPPRCHDPALFVDPGHLQSLFRRGGVELAVHGLAPHPAQYLRFLATRRGPVRMRRHPGLSGVYAGVGVKAAVPRRPERPTRARTRVHAVADDGTSEEAR